MKGTVISALPLDIDLYNRSAPAYNHNQAYSRKLIKVQHDGGRAFKRKETGERDMQNDILFGDGRCYFAFVRIYIHIILGEHRNIVPRELPNRGTHARLHMYV